MREHELATDDLIGSACRRLPDQSIEADIIHEQTSVLQLHECMFVVAKGGHSRCRHASKVVKV